MIEKIKELLNAPRFWQVTLAAVFLILGHYLPNLEYLWNVLAGWQAAVAGIGTLDSVATKVSSKKAEPVK